MEPVILFLFICKQPFRTNLQFTFFDKIKIAKKEKKRKRKKEELI